MRILHNSRDLTYRKPFGAVQLGGTVDLAVDVFDAPKAQATLRLWIDGTGERLVPMEAEYLGDRIRFHGRIEPEVLEIHWYSFIVEDGEGNVRFLGAREGTVGGEGETYWSLPPSFQITVYRDRKVRPEWFERAIVYQIFPDRFNRGEGWRDIVVPELENTRHGARRRLVEDWDKPVTYERDETGDVVAWDFYGGTLNGIAEKLDYLQELGITAIYLNPIFEALSDHRYDTGDYMVVDPILGTVDDFRHLAMEASKRGISIILDGVFNHTGTDSRYFNKFGDYDTLGAAQSSDSPYHDWYLLRPDGTYESWWGVKNMPAMNKESAGWRDFVFGRNGIIETWLQRGARGWRLDVADELTDDFIARIKEAEDREKPDALLLGEVWEDASHKVAYSQMRHYFCGNELDGVMNYPFRTDLLQFLRGEIGAAQFAEDMEALRENYPPHAFRSCLTLIGSHDRARVLTMLSGAPDPDTLSDEEKRTWQIPEWDLNLAKSRLWQALLVQMCWPGPPCIYYGDEAGMQGMTDPYNRATYPWGHEDQGVMAMYRNTIDLRRSLPFLATADFEAFNVGDDVFGFWREGTDQSLCVLINRSETETAMVELPMKGDNASDLVSGARLAVQPDGETLTLPVWPRGSAVIYFHPGQKIAKPLDWGTGIFCAIGSLPNEHGKGTIGEPAKRFVDFLAETHQSYWQILPLNPPDAFGSPYSGPSAFAADPNLIDTGGRPLDEVVDEFEPDGAFAKFVVDEERWLRPYATFMAIRDHLAKESEDGFAGTWDTWPEPYDRYDPDLARRPELAGDVRRHMIVQYLFQRQWDELKAYANERGVKIIGDMPFYVARDSADVWAFRDRFNVDDDGKATLVAGYPPDWDNPEGQLWGNPTYNWDMLKGVNYRWWIRRLGRAFQLYDVLRLDHFLGFNRYWGIPAGEPASAGRWYQGPGVDFFREAYKQFGPLPVIGEDLGEVTPAVRALIAKTGITGMDIAIYHDGDIRESYEPQVGKVAYTSTHDSNTLLGWVEGRFYPDMFQTPTERARAMAEHHAREGAGDGEEPDAAEPIDLALAKTDLAKEEIAAKETATEIIRRVLLSDAPVTIQPLQDVFLLDASARMNTPGTTGGGNWEWQARQEDLDAAREMLRVLTEATARQATDPPRRQRHHRNA